MKYKIYRFSFKTAVHFGGGSLSDGNIAFHADSLFSALCLETVKNSQSELDKMKELFSNGGLCLSDAFPFVGDTLFLPKPCCYVERKSDRDEGSSVVKKQYKKLKYISAQNFGKYFDSTLDPANELELLGNLGTYRLKTSVLISEAEESMPYNVGVYTFNQNCGLYVIAGYDKEEYVEWLEKYLTGLSYSGIGGKRSAGLGRFELSVCDAPGILLNRLNADGEMYMLLACAFPADEELPASLDGAQYSVLRRGGFVSSFTYTDSCERKKDIFLFDSGSCFKSKFKGRIFDVSRGSGHPVYRYAVPMWLEVKK